MITDLFASSRSTSVYDTVAAPASVVRSTSLTDAHRVYASIFTHVHDAACYGGDTAFTATVLCSYRATR
jgi:hypothetical protein